MLHCFFFILVLVFIQEANSIATTICPNKCSGNGYCVDGSVGYCACFAGFTGGDCSLRVCPAGTAWVDAPSSNNTAHAAFTECSNMGVCDRKKGVCRCRSGFGGAACDLMLCPVVLTPLAVLDFSGKRAICSGNGRCLSLRQVNAYQDYVQYVGSRDYNGWDADMIHGCVCDSGWEGVACEKRSCPRGDDPQTPGVDDTQVLDCKCLSCEGGLRLTFEGQQTAFIPYDASAKLIEYRLQQLSSMAFVSVEFALGGTEMCSAGGTITTITFQSRSPLKSAIVVLPEKGLDGDKIAIQWRGHSSQLDSDVRSAVGSKEWAECSNRGLCDYSTGTCECYGGYASSDRRGGEGTVGDCGFQRYSTFNYSISNSSLVVRAKCPFAKDSICAGNGFCNELLGTCECHSGYEGPACASLTCPTTFTWFGKIDDQHSGTSVCGGVGDCDGETGKCINCGGSAGLFYGDQCQFLSCFKDQNGQCSGNGACLTMRELAKVSYGADKRLSRLSYDEPWDADHIRGCACSRSISVDNQFDPNYRRVIDFHAFNATTNASVFFTADDLTKFYRGPFAFAATDFTGYNCQNALCPVGDHPLTRGVNDIQTLNCLASNGSFQLTFRENTTLPISINATAAELEFLLEQIYTISDVSVYLELNATTNSSICNPFNNITVYVEFLTEFGDLPLMEPAVLSSDNGDFEVVVGKHQRGTKVELECSALGTCDEAKGICACFEGFGSSNGSTAAPGERGDCSFVNPLYTQKYLLSRPKK